MAWLYTQVSVLVGTLSMMLFAIVLVIFRDCLGLLFTSDPEVILLTIFPMLAVSLIGGRRQGEGRSMTEADTGISAGLHTMPMASPRFRSPSPPHGFDLEDVRGYQFTSATHIMSD